MFVELKKILQIHLSSKCVSILLLVLTMLRVVLLFSDIRFSLQHYTGKLKHRIIHNNMGQ